MLNILDNINLVPSVEIKPGNFVLIRGRPCKVRKIHHVIFSTPVSSVPYGNKTVEIRAIDMLTRTTCNWLGYGHTKLNKFFPVEEKLLFIILSEKFVVGLSMKNKMIYIPLTRSHPLRPTISGEKWAGDLYILRVPIMKDGKLEEVVCLEKVVSWI